MTTEHAVMLSQDKEISDVDVSKFILRHRIPAFNNFHSID